VWVVTEAGLDRLQPAPFTSVGPSRGLPFDSPKWIAPDASGAIWAVAFPGQELYWLDGGIIRGEPGQVTGKPRGASTTAEFRALNPARDSGVWVYDGRMHRIVRVTTDRVIPTSPSIGDYVTIAFENTRRQLWAAAGGNPLGWASRGTWQRGILPNESDTALTHQIGEDASGRMLVLRDPDLYVIDSGRVIRTIGPENGLARVNRQVVVDGVDTLWTQDNDSSLYRIIGTQVSRVSSAALVPHLASRSTALVPAGDKFFIASSSGITSVSRAALHATADGRAPFPAMRRYSALDGASMARLTVQNVSAAFTATDGRIWFSTPAGLLVYDARDDGPNAVAPVVHIEEVRAVDSVLARDSIVRVPPGAERVQFRFTATALRLPERARLEFKLDGIDANWRLADATRTVTYTQLRPHRYTFRVRAWNEDGVPAAAAALSLRVMPLWYQSWWFISLAVLAAIGSTAGVVALALRARQRVVASRLAAGFEATLAERTRLAGELHDTLLQAFTGVTLQLQALRSRIVAAPQEVERDIGRVLTVADGALREARSAVWDMRAPELEGRDVAAALEDSARDAIDAHTLAGGAPVELVVTVSGRRRRVAPVIEIAAHRIGREAVANALRHASAKQVSLTIDFEPRHLCLEVRDNGVGFDISGVTPTEGRGHWGLVGMRERARNAGGSLDVASIPGSGTVLILRLPIAPT
jgi:signal transduction histidine kinase